MPDPAHAPKPRGWITSTVVGIVLATLFSDFSHEMATSALPSYLLALGLGPSALGLIEGVADFLVSLAKLAGGATGNRAKRKKPLVAIGYVLTALGTSAMGFARALVPLVLLRTAAWIARGFRSPLRDFLLADEVNRTHYGRAYGLERAGDMLGAVAGPALAAILLGVGLPVRSVLFWAVVPGLVAALAIVALVRERSDRADVAAGPEGVPAGDIPKAFWLLLAGIVLFGLGDFSRTFLILIASRSLQAGGSSPASGLPWPVILYAGHNLVSALAAYPAGRWADRGSKIRILAVGYFLAVLTHLLLAWRGGELSGVVIAMALSGIYVSVRDVVEKAAVAQLLPRDRRSLGLGFLAFANAAGDLVSSLAVGVLLERGRPGLAFGIPAAAGIVSVLWLLGFLRRIEAGS